MTKDWLEWKFHTPIESVAGRSRNLQVAPDGFSLFVRKLKHAAAPWKMSGLQLNASCNLMVSIQSLCA